MLNESMIPIEQWTLIEEKRNHQESVTLTFDSGDDAQGRIPVTVIHGTEDGPVLLILAAVHGDEYEGIQTILEIQRWIQPALLSGTLLMVPIANLWAYEGESRITPQDGKNLAREFPGDPSGACTQRLAWHIHHKLIASCDFLLDLHSGGSDFAVVPLTGFYYDPSSELGQRSEAAARAFGMDILWAHEAIAPGRTISSAQQLGIPWIYTEAYGGKRILRSEQQQFTMGALRLMNHLGMVRSDPFLLPEARQARLFIGGDGNFDLSAVAADSGFFVAHKQLADEVATGDVIGQIYDWQGYLLQSVQAERDGILVMIAGKPRVNKGDHLYLIAEKLPIDSGE